jgi:hypothetical protein
LEIQLNFKKWFWKGRVWIKNFDIENSIYFEKMILKGKISQVTSSHLGQW